MGQVYKSDQYLLCPADMLFLDYDHARFRVIEAKEHG